MQGHRHVWRRQAEIIAAREPTQFDTVESFLSLLEFVTINEWEGGCHALAAILHVLFGEAGVNSTLVLGEAGIGPLVFDHSWVNAAGAVYDVAIVRPLATAFRMPATFRGLELETDSTPRVRYGTSSGSARGEAAQFVLTLPFHDFMSGFPAHRDGLWGIASIVAQRFGKKLEVPDLKKRYGATVWTTS
jgi:hypothetical protein